jgi:NitT/TauT family transport system substrate-binding protein
MKKTLLIALFVCMMLLPACTSGTPSSESGLQPVSLQLQWITQAQFAGFYVALDKGWYREEGLNLTIKPGDAEVSAVDQVAAGSSDFGTAFLSDLSVAIQKGQLVVSIAQVQQMNGLLLIAKKDSGIKRPGDLSGKKIGIWGASWETQLNALLARQGIDRKDVEIVPQGYDMQLFLRGEIDVASAMIYNEYHQVLESGLKIQDINIIDYSLYGLGFPGDALFTRRRLEEQNPEVCVKMLRASLRGWQYAVDNPKEAVDIVLKYDQTGQQTREHQISMMREIARLVKVSWIKMGYTDSKSVQQMLNTLALYKVLPETMKADTVFTNDIWDQAAIEK